MKNCRKRGECGLCNKLGYNLIERSEVFLNKNETFNFVFRVQGKE